MPAERFFVNSPLTDEVTIEGAEFHHLVHVMRIRVGEEVELVNGKGSLAKAKLQYLGKNSATLEVISKVDNPTRPQNYVLAIPILRMSKLEWILEKCTELGVDAFFLYPSDQSEKTSLSLNQLERLNHIAISAMKQCGRLDLPDIQVFSSLKDLLKAPFPILYGDINPNAPFISPQEKALFVSGPEGGFSKKEELLLKEKAKGVSLHKNILRAETAPIVAIIYLQQNQERL